MHEELSAFICSKCGKQLHRQGEEGLICLNGHVVVPIDGVYDFLDESLHDIIISYGAGGAGGGVGYDLELLLNSGIVCREYVFSEISQELALYVQN